MPSTFELYMDIYVYYAHGFINSTEKREFISEKERNTSDPPKNPSNPPPSPNPLIPQVITMCYNRNAVKVWIINIGDIKTTCSITTYSTTRQF